MATLVSPGVSVTVTDESFYIPASAPTVPILFIATAQNKVNEINGQDIIAPGTTESNVLRTVTSITQSVELYGIPRFLTSPDPDPTDAEIPQHHGDVRNEYGLFAVNQFLSVGNRAYVVRADVNLNDDPVAVQEMWADAITAAGTTLGVLTQEYLDTLNTMAGSPPGLVFPGEPGYRDTINPAELKSLLDTALLPVFDMYTFKNIESDFRDDQSAAPFPVYANGWPPETETNNYYGLDFIIDNIEVAVGGPCCCCNTFPGGGTVAGEWTPQEANDLLLAAADEYQFTSSFVTLTSLGANDDARRLSIDTALRATILKADAVWGTESIEYNLVLCPGYPENIPELQTLVAKTLSESMIIGDTPSFANLDTVTSPGGTDWLPQGPKYGNQQGVGGGFVQVAYYYPWVEESNLDGVRVVTAPAGAALRTYANNDVVGYPWFAPAGLRRGAVTGAISVGYVSGQLGGPTDWNELDLNQGDRDVLYEYTEGGNINPIAFMAGRGYYVWGQKTQNGTTAQATDRVNVTRLVLKIKRDVRKMALSWVFEPNDQLTRDNIKAAIDGYLGDLIVRRGLYDFVTVCDSTNNTPVRIDRNELWVDIALKPVRAIEFIYIPIRIVATGAEI